MNINANPVLENTVHKIKISLESYVNDTIVDESYSINCVNFKLSKKIKSYYNDFNVYFISFNSSEDSYGLKLYIPKSFEKEINNTVINFKDVYILFSQKNNSFYDGVEDFTKDVLNDIKDDFSLQFSKWAKSLINNSIQFNFIGRKTNKVTKNGFFKISFNNINK